MNIIDRFSTHLREVLVGSVRIAAELKNKSVKPAHLLLALSLQKGSVASEVLNRYHLDAKSIVPLLKNQMRGITREGEKDDGKNFEPDLKKNPSPFSLNAKAALEKALMVAQKNGHNYLGTEHLLSALINLNDPQIEQLLKKGGRAELDEQLEIVLNTASQFPQITEVPEVMDRLQDGLSDDALLQTLLPGNKSKKSPSGGSPAGRESALDFFAANLTSPDIQSGIYPVISPQKKI